VDRLSGELARTAAAARFYGEVAADGGWLGARIDRVESPSAVELRRANLSIGPVAVFGASNFPFGFGVVGHDTCSALAAGCPVVAKAHPAHPLLSVRLAEVASEALAEAGAPSGSLTLVVGFRPGAQLVEAPEVAAVAFTGSQPGGMALVELAGRRPTPIPVYAEMGTVNPAVVTPSAVEDLEEIASGFVESFTLGLGQFCTKPGLLLTPRGANGPKLVAELVDRRPGGVMLSEGIATAFGAGVDELCAAGATLLSRGTAPVAGFCAAPVVLTAEAGLLQPSSRLLEECFGPVALVVEYDDPAEVGAILQRLQPSLAGSVWAADPTDPWLAEAVAVLGRQVGRVVVNGWPTGVTTSWAIHHGGPWPTTSRPEATSVGAHALDRFTRPVCFQDAPQEALPAPLRDDNPWGVPQTVTERRP
jgi:NADP-dependent aldehyde dehydrogenase